MIEGARCQGAEDYPDRGTRRVAGIAGARRRSWRELGLAVLVASKTFRASSIAGRFALAHSATATKGPRNVWPNFVSS
jgi:hypothetical protein